MKELIKDTVSYVKAQKEKDEQFSTYICVANFVLALVTFSMFKTTFDFIVQMVQSVSGSFIATIVMIAYVCATLMVLFVYIGTVIILLADVALSLHE